MEHYHINIFCSDEDECYIADIPDLKFCSACGDTPEEALREALTAKAKRKTIPKPKYRPAIYQVQS